MNYYLKLDKSYRVEINWNCHIEFCALKGIKDLSGLDEMANLSPADLLDFMWCSIKEGERMENNKFCITAKELGSLLKPADIVSFLNIYKEQCSISVEKTSGNNEVKKKNLFRLRSSKA